MKMETAIQSGLKNPEKPLERSSEEIRQNISAKMESLSETIDQLSGRMKETFNWREHVVRHPYVALGAAAGLGFLLSGILKPSPTPGERIIDTISETVEDITKSLSSSQKGISQTTPSFLVTTVSTIIIKAGIDFLLSKINDRSVQDTTTNGKPAHH